MFLYVNNTGVHHTGNSIAYHSLEGSAPTCKQRILQKKHASFPSEERPYSHSCMPQQEQAKGKNRDTLWRKKGPDYNISANS